MVAALHSHLLYTLDVLHDCMRESIRTWIEIDHESNVQWWTLPQCQYESTYTHAYRDGILSVAYTCTCI